MKPKKILPVLFLVLFVMTAVHNLHAEVSRVEVTSRSEVLDGKVVRRVDELGNEVAGIQNTEVQVPLATYTPWCTRKGYPGSPFELVDFRGSYIPLPVTESEKKATGDPRPSISSLYDGKADYLGQVREAAHKLVRQRFLLQEDVSYVVERSKQYWEWIHEKN